MDNAAIMTLLRNRLQIIDGCAQAIDIDTKNSAGTRHKARTIHRVSEELLDENESPFTTTTGRPSRRKLANDERQDR